MVSKENSNKKRLIRHKRMRNNLSGTSEKPRLNVFRSTKHIYVQVIDDTKGITLVSASTVEADVANAVEGKTKTEAAKIVGQIAAERAKGKGIEAVVFDRGGYIYHGRVKAVADGAREAGLAF
jgi:ribosomal protein L18